MQSPVFAAIKQAHPDWHVTVWVAPRGTKALAENDPNIDEVIEMPIKASVAAHVLQILKLRRRKLDVGIVLSPGQLWKGAGYLYLAGISQRIGNSYPFRGNPHSSFLLTDAVKELEHLHDIEQNLRLLIPLGITSYKLPVTSYQLDIPSAYGLRAKAIVDRLPRDKKLIGFHTGSAPGFEWKRWPVENFIEVGRALIEKKSAHILIFGGPDEKELKLQLNAGLGEHSTIVEEDLLTTAAIIAHCKLFLSNDSGLMHVAAAVGIPTYGLFGPTDEKKTGPRGEKSFAIRAAGTRPVYETENKSHWRSISHSSLLELGYKQVLDRVATV